MTEVFCVRICVRKKSKIWLKSAKIGKKYGIENYNNINKVYNFRRLGNSRVSSLN